MLLIQQIRDTLPDNEKYSDADVEKIRNSLDQLADILFDRWLRERNVPKRHQVENRN